MPTTPARFNILVVDDSPVSLRFVSDILQGEGYRVNTAGNGFDALARARLELPSLMILDVHMPEMDGYEVCSRFKSDPLTRDVPVIFITTSVDIKAEKKAFEVGADDFIHKPINAIVLLAHVRNSLAREVRSKGLQTQFQSVLQSAPVVFLLAREDQGVVIANQVAAQKFGYEYASDVVGLPLDVLIPSYSQYLTPAGASLRVGEIGPLNSVEISCRRKDGHVFFVSATFSRVMSEIGEAVMVTLSDITDKKQMLSDLGVSRSLIRDLAARNEAAREMERKEIARDVHDELGQVLSALRMDVFMLRRDYQEDDPELGARLTHLRDLVDRAIADVRSISSSLRPAVLDMGLYAAIDWLQDDFTKRTKVRCTLRFENTQLHLDELRSVVLYRIVQESLNNVAKYAQATEVILSVAQTGDEVTVFIQDDGIGFEVEDAIDRRTYGLQGMQERALVLDGKLTIRSHLGQGTSVRVTFPITATQ